MDKLLEHTVVIRFSAVQYCCAKKCPDVYRNRWNDRPKFLPVNCWTRSFPWNSLDKNRTAPQTQKICELVVYLGSIKCSISWVQLPSHSKLIETSFQLLNKSMTKLYDLLILAHQHQKENSTHCSLYMSYATNMENLLNDWKILCLLINHYWANFSCKGLTLYTICTEAYIYSCILKLITDRSLRDVFFHPVTSVGQKKNWNLHEESNLKPSDSTSLLNGSKKLVFVSRL